MKILSNFIALLSVYALLTSCSMNSSNSTQNHVHTTLAPDKHSFSKPNEARISHLELDIEVDFSSKTIQGFAEYDIVNLAKAKEIIFDVRQIIISKIEVDGKVCDNFSIGEEKEFLGQSLTVPISEESKKVKIHYRTKAEAAALQWLEAEQTGDKKAPFLYTQSQAVLGRSWIPSQDSPGVRFTYNAKVKVPKGLLALMSAENPQTKNDTGVYQFSMKQPVPSYLVALAVGDLEFRAVGGNTGVYAEPSVIQSAHAEFQDIDKMMAAAEEMYGKYQWERYDLLVLPKSFPFGGMENPRLTFVTPTIIAGDRSLVSVVAHELAHSWSGNLVTNANWEELWLNEGFTVYFEMRIMEKLNGKEYAEMLAMIEHEELKDELASLPKEETQLKLNLDNRDPDDGINTVAYNKGYMFLRLCEETIGREKWDAFLKEYFQTYAFKTIHSEGFLSYFESKFGKEVAEKIDAKRWIYQDGLPENCPKLSEESFKVVSSAITHITLGAKPSTVDTKTWKYQQWVYFINKLPDNVSIAQLKDVDAAFKFSQSGNNEILFAWLMRSVKSRYRDAYPVLETFLNAVGRRKFVAPLFAAMLENDDTRDLAAKIYKSARTNYHFVTYSTIDGLFEDKKVALP